MNYSYHEQMQTRVLDWVYTLQIAPNQFKINEGADSTIFTTCFALFIFNLLGQVKNWSQSERNVWSDYIIFFRMLTVDILSRRTIKETWKQNPFIS